MTALFKAFLKVVDSRIISINTNPIMDEYFETEEDEFRARFSSGFEYGDCVIVAVFSNTDVVYLLSDLDSFWEEYDKTFGGEDTEGDIEVMLVVPRLGVWERLLEALGGPSKIVQL